MKQQPRWRLEAVSTNGDRIVVPDCAITIIGHLYGDYELTFAGPRFTITDGSEYPETRQQRIAAKIRSTYPRKD